MKNLKNKTIKSTCLDEIKINRYVLHQCSSKERREIEAHLVICPLCRSDVIFLTKNQPGIQDEKVWGEITPDLYRKGMDLVKEMTKHSVFSLLEIYLRFVREKWEVFRHTGRVMTQPVLAARGEIPEKKAIISNLVKEFNEFRVEADLSENVKGTIDLQIRVKRLEDMKLTPQLQFILLDKKRKRILYESTRDGEISFEGLAPGLYSIRIAQKEGLIGEISLCTENP